METALIEIKMVVIIPAAEEMIDEVVIQVVAVEIICHNVMEIGHVAVAQTKILHGEMNATGWKFFF